RNLLSRPQQAIIEAAQRFGMRDGFTVPTNVPGEPEGSISFATRSARRITVEHQLILEAIGRITFEAARRIMGFSTSTPS
ncbi:autoinducer binding domain-containing protein, partial [Clostridium perfringens]